MASFKFSSYNKDNHSFMGSNTGHALWLYDIEAKRFIKPDFIRYEGKGCPEWNIPVGKEILLVKWKYWAKENPPHAVYVKHVKVKDENTLETLKSASFRFDRSSIPLDSPALPLIKYVLKNSPAYHTSANYDDAELDLDLNAIFGSDSTDIVYYRFPYHSVHNQSFMGSNKGHARWIYDIKAKRFVKPEYIRYEGKGCPEWYIPVGKEILLVDWKYWNKIEPPHTVELTYVKVVSENELDYIRSRYFSFFKSLKTTPADHPAIELFKYVLKRFPSYHGSADYDDIELDLDLDAIFKYPKNE